MIKEKLKKEAEEWLNKWELCNKCEHKAECIEECSYCHLVVNRAYVAGAESTLRKVTRYFSTIVLDENCGGYFSKLLESEEKLQELAKELENV